MKIFLSAAFVMILFMGWGVYVKETYVPPGMQNDPSTPVTVTDTEAPTKPTNLVTAAVTSNRMSLKWAGSR